MVNIVLVQCVTRSVNSNSAQKAKNVCRILTGKVDNYVQLFLTNVDPHDCNVPGEALPRAWIANTSPKTWGWEQGLVLHCMFAAGDGLEVSPARCRGTSTSLVHTRKLIVMPECPKATKTSPEKLWVSCLQWQTAAPFLVADLGL